MKLAWMCPNCHLAWEEPYCDWCGLNLASRERRALTAVVEPVLRHLRQFAPPKDAA